MQQAFANPSNKTVRLGYIQYKGYQDGNENIAKSGRAYEYLQRLRYYTGWKFEYVYASASELLKELEAGNVDIVPLVNYTKERSEKYFFSDEALGIEAFFLYAHKDDMSVVANDIQSVNGKRIGVIFDTYQEALLKKWCKENSIVCDIVSYDENKELYHALNGRKIDLVMELRILREFGENPPWKIIHRFPSSPLYIAVSKSRPDLLEELNTAQKQLISLDEFYGYKALENYHDEEKYHDISLTPKQEEYLRTCGVLKVGYLGNAQPLSHGFFDEETETVVFQGLAEEYLQAMGKVFGLQYEAVMYADEAALLKDLQAGKIDIGLPVTCEKCVVEAQNISITKSMLSMPISVVHKIPQALKQDFSGTIAILENRPMQYSFVRNKFSRAKIHYTPSTEEALELIEKGEAEYFFIKTKYLELNNLVYQISSRFHLGDVPDNVETHMAVLSDNPVLVSILDKGILLIPEGLKNSYLIRYEFIDVKPSLRNALKEHVWLVSMMSVLTVFLILFFLNYYKKDKAVQKKLLQEEKVKTEQAQMKARVDSLTKCYNRVTFEEKIEEYLAADYACGVLLILDMDYFKEVNDTFGHPKGDRLLLDTAKVLRSFFRSNDFVARLGGDEFAVFLEGMNDKEIVEQKLAILNKKLCQTITDERGHVVNVSASIGVVFAPQNGKNYEELYQNADKALYEAKKAGRNTFSIFKGDL